MAAFPAIRKSQVENLYSGVVPVEGLEDLEENLLRQVERVLPVADHLATWAITRVW